MPTTRLSSGNPVTRLSSLSWLRPAGLRRSLAVLAAGLVLSNCGSDGPTTPPAAVSSVVLGGLPAENVVLAAATVQLSAQPRSAAGAVLDRPVTWTSSDNAIATVSATGLVTGVAPGPVTITATSEGVGGSALMSIRSPISVPPASAGTPVTTSTLGGAVTLTIPPAATTTTTTLTVAPAASVPADSRLVAGGTFDFGPSGTTFTTPITLELSFSPAAVPASKREDLRIYQVLDGGTLQLVPGGSVDLVNNKVIAPISHFSTYAVVQQPDPTQMSVSAGDNQSAAIATAVATAPAVLVRDAQNRPVAFADVSFAVTAGGGSLSGATTVETDAAGLATLPGEWTLGATPGTNTLTATVVGTAITATVTATATAPATQLAVTADVSAATSGVAFPTAIVVAVRNAFDGTVTTSTATVTAALSSGSGTLVGTTTVNAVNGVATFSNLRINGAGAHQITFTATGLTAATSQVIAVTQQLASLAITTQPGNATSNAAFGTQPVIELRDHAGLRLIGGTTVVTAARASGSGTLYGTTSRAAVDGVVTFTDLAIEGSGLHALSFTAPGVAAMLGQSFDVAALAPGIRLKVGAAPAVTLTAGAQIQVPVVADLSNRGGDDLASISVSLSWDPALFDFVSNASGAWTDATGGSSTVVVNDTETAAGTLNVAAFTTGATTSSVTITTITLQAKTPVTTTATDITASIGAAGNAAGSAITVTPRTLGVSILVP